MTPCGAAAVKGGVDGMVGDLALTGGSWQRLADAAGLRPRSSAEPEAVTADVQAAAEKAVAVTKQGVDLGVAARRRVMFGLVTKRVQANVDELEGDRGVEQRFERKMSVGQSSPRFRRQHIAPGSTTLPRAFLLHAIWSASALRTEGSISGETTQPWFLLPPLH